MSFTLKTLHESISQKPELRDADGILVAVSGKHTTQFASNTEAQFFVAAYNEVPALIAELEARRATDKDAEIGAARLEAATYYERIGELEAKLAETEARLTEETKRRTEAQVRARTLAQALVRMRNALGNKSA
jgi:hypothetical protein